MQNTETVGTRPMFTKDAAAAVGGGGRGLAVL